MADIEKYLKLYYQLGFNNMEILSMLAQVHGVIISISTLKRKLKSAGLFRRKRHSDILDVASYILDQLNGSGALHGYRWMHLKCTQAGLRVPRDTVLGLMQLLDPEGIKSRQRRRLKRRRYVNPGPNFTWHIDSYDKLKPYGIAINGCIDGYSSCLIWLHAGTTNSDPKVIADYFIQEVKKRGGCPSRVRADFGTENTYVENMQMFLRRDHGDEFAGERSYLAGRSTHNQRIEWFWGILRKEMGQFYMDLFTDLMNDDNDLFCGDLLDKNLIQFCFLKIIQVCW